MSFTKVRDMDKERAKEFFDKAERLLRWGEELLAEMQAHAATGTVDKVERTFVSTISFFDSLHEALVDCAKKIDQEDWRSQLNAFREADPLLRYLWKARNSETHDALVKWRDGMKLVEMRIIDQKKADEAMGFSRLCGEKAALEKLFCVVYGVDSREALMEKLKEGTPPSPDAMVRVGVELIHSLDALALDAFSIGREKKAERIDAPTSHNGKVLPPSAITAVRAAISYYQAKLDELRSQIVVISAR